MSDIFANVYGARFPDVVMNQGPLPSAGRLPAPLHDTPDARINYNSTLLGDLEPYAYGQGAYQSSGAQNNTPHRIQKIVPKLHLPEPNGKDVFLLSHGVDDSDLAFVMRLNRNSVFCTGTRGGTRRTTNFGTSIDPMINLATLNYLLAGLQVAMPLMPSRDSLWWELLFNLDPRYWPEPESGKRDYRTDLVSADHPTNGLKFPYPQYRPFCLEDLVHFIRTSVRPFGIVRGSEKQGGQHEMSNSPATWPVSAVCTLVIDGKEANVVNLWHHKDVNAGDDLVLRLKLMPLKTYTLNHYYKGFARKTFEAARDSYVWQLVPDVFDLSIGEKYHEELNHVQCIPLSPGDNHRHAMRKKRLFSMLWDHKQRETLTRDEAMIPGSGANPDVPYPVWSHITMPFLKNDPLYVIPWQEMGYWHIGRSQVMASKYGNSEFYNDDLANGLKTNHMDMTVQPVFVRLPRIRYGSGLLAEDRRTPFKVMGGEEDQASARHGWEPELRLERMRPPPPKRVAPVFRAPVAPSREGGASRPGRCLANDRVVPEPPVVDFGADFNVPQRTDTGMDSDATGPAQGAPLAAVVPDLGGPGPEGGDPAEISGSAREELLSGLGPPAGALAPKKPAAKARGKKAQEPQGVRDPVEGTLLRPGAPPEACQMELL